VKISPYISRAVGLSIVLASLTAVAPAQPVLVSSVNSGGSSATASGDSLNPGISRDGRYILYSSSANNLTTNADGAAFAPVYPAKLNVFLYDRTNGTTTLVSVNTNGTGGGNGDSFAVEISTNGQFALFESAATNLVTGDTNGFNDVFVRDIVNGITTLVSVGTNGIAGNGAARSSTMTPDGRYVAFVSAASNLVANDTNGIPDIFVRDLVASNTVLVSVGAMYTNTVSVPTNSSEWPDISDDGRYVAFYSTATNLVPGVATTSEIYVRDLAGGVTLLASTNSRSIVQAAFNTSNVISCDHAISADGQYVAYLAGVPNLNNAFNSGVLVRYHVFTGATDIVNTNVQGPIVGSEAYDRSLDMSRDGNFITFITNSYVQSSNLAPDAVWIWNAQSDTTTLVSSNFVTNALSIPDYFWPQLSEDGRYVSFFSAVSNLTADPTVTGYHLYVYDSLATNISLVDPRTNGSAPSYFPVNPPSLSSNGQFIVFDSFDPDLVVDDGNVGYDVFLRDLSTNAVELISAASPALLSLSPAGASLLSSFSVSTNARYVAFSSEAVNLTANDTNLLRDVFVYDRLIGSNTLVSVATNGFSGNGISRDPTISGDGRYVAFTSNSSNLVAGVTNGVRNVYLRDLQAGMTTLVSINSSSNGSGNADSYSPIISVDGRYVLFHSKANNLAPGFSNTNDESLFRRDTQTGTTIAVVTNTSGVAPVIAGMSPDGRYVAYGSSQLTTYVWDLQTFDWIYSNTGKATAVAVNSDGTRFAFSTSSQVFFVNITANTNLLLSSPAVTSHPGLQFSANGQYLVFNSGGSGKTNQVVIFNFLTGATNLISKNYNSSVGGNGASDAAVISPDGRFVAYRSFAGNIVPGGSNGFPQIYLYDQNSGDTTLVTSSLYGNFPANNRSLFPAFSPDSQTLLLTSWASDFAPQDFNQSGDVVAFSLYNSNSAPSLIITITPSATIAWPAIEGMSYQVQFKNNLTDPMWQVLNGNVSIVGSQGYATDLAPASTQRFYRVMAY
jgi:Tol biopolymer transport system component